MKKKRAARIDVDVPISAPAKTRLYIDEDVANALRKVERAELGAFLEMLLRYWLKSERPQWQVREGSDS